MWKREVGLFTAACVLIIAVLLIGNNHWHRFVEPPAADPTSDGPDYSHGPATWAGRQACQECHAAADSVWTGSDHDLAMQLPGPTTITADFDDAQYTHFGVTSSFYRDGDKYMVRTDGPNGEMTDFEVAYVFGYFPLEQFLIRFPDGRLQSLNICWDTTKAEDGGQRWFQLYPNDETPADDLFHWTGPLQNWNFMCADCHSTNLQRNYDAQSNTYQTTWSELDVSCETCHGPGSRHIQWEKAFAQGLRPRNADGARGLVVDLKSPDQGVWAFEPGEATAKRTEPLASRVEVESCARCHARRGPLTLEYEYGQPFTDHYRLTLLNEELYYADGQNQDEVYVYGSFLQSKMYAAGVTCSDCHDYHSTLTVGTGNQVCARCHRAEVFDTPEHHFHQMGKGGDSCLDCHQQARKVMVVDARRDHSFRIPRPDLSLSEGTPNACSDCHDDKSVQWSQDAIVKWYGAERKQGAHYAVALQAGRVGSPLALDRLRALIVAKDQPDIAKATALTLVTRYAEGAAVPEVVAALSSADPLMRSAAVEALSTSTAVAQLRLSLPLLDDPVRLVRLSAARNLALLPAEAIGPAEQAAVAAARDLYLEYMSVNLERAETHLNLAMVHIAEGRFKLAEANFKNALERTIRYAPAYVNYADFLRRQDRLPEAEAMLRRGIRDATGAADCHHALGLLLVSQGNLTAALERLEAAYEQRPEYPRYGYVYAVALQSGQNLAASLTVLEQVIEHHPWDVPSLQALVIYAMEAGQPARGLPSAEKLVQLDPSSAEARGMRDQVRRAAGR